MNSTFCSHWRVLPGRGRESPYVKVSDGVEMKDESLCVAHIVAVSRNDRKLRAGDELLSCFIGHIGDTSIFAERHVLDVLDVGEADVPELVNPTSI